MSNLTAAEQEEILDDFVKRCAIDRHVAYDLLSCNKWNPHKALDVYKIATQTNQRRPRDGSPARGFRSNQRNFPVQRGGATVTAFPSQHPHIIDNLKTRQPHVTQVQVAPTGRLPQTPMFPVVRGAGPSQSIEYLGQRPTDVRKAAKERIIPVEVETPTAVIANTEGKPIHLPAITKVHDLNGVQHPFEKTSKYSNEAEVTCESPDPANKDPGYKLKRGLSTVGENMSLVSQARISVLQDIEEDHHEHMNTHTFVLPDLNTFENDFRAFLERELIDVSTLMSLVHAGRLNWWYEYGVSQRLLPMATSGDGNCLLHAASLAMWGFHDRNLILRKALFDMMTSAKSSDALYRRWRWQQTQVNKETDLILSEQEWSKEWDNLLQLASAKPRNVQETPRSDSSSDLTTQRANGPSPLPVYYESLEEFHVFILAHVLQRAIIVVADTMLKDQNGDPLAPIPFGGIYLPLECDPKKCYSYPLLLTYDAAHFSALVPMVSRGNKNVLPAAIPVTSPLLEFLPIHYAVDPGAKFQWNKAESSKAAKELTNEMKLNLLKRYLMIEKLPLTVPRDEFDNDRMYDSDDPGKDKANNRMSQQLNVVSKQFGSLGKSVGKKLKNIGNPKASKHDKSSSNGKAKPLEYAFCVKISTQKEATQEEMIKRYINDARERYTEHQNEMQNDHTTKTVNSASRGGRPSCVECVTPGCREFGSSSSSYLCSTCFSQLKQAALSQEKHLSTAVSTNKEYSHISPNYMDETHKCGKSRFYTAVPEEEVVKPVDSSRNLNPHSSNLAPPSTHGRPTSSQYSTNLSKPNATRPDRTPSPDYDNVDYTVYKGPNSTSKSNPGDKISPSSSKCRREGCEFYGRQETNGFCSNCFKNLHGRPSSRV